jgi:hypothetical protein
MRKMSKRIAYDYDVRDTPERPLISGQKAFPLSGMTPNPPFAAGKQVFPSRFNLAAAGKAQVYQSSLPCQYVLLINEGGGDLLWGFDGVNTTAPAAGARTDNANLIASGAAERIDMDDAIHLWIASVAGTLVSIQVGGISFVKVPGT